MPYVELVDDDAVVIVDDDGVPIFGQASIGQGSFPITKRDGSPIPIATGAKRADTAANAGKRRTSHNATRPTIS